MNLLFTICGRAGSKGVKNKNIRDFMGWPLPYYTLSAILLYLKEHGTRFGRCDIALSTDSAELMALFKKVSPEVFIIKRANELSGDDVGKIDVIRNCTLLTEAHYGIIYDMVVDLDITSPLRTVEDLGATIDKKKRIDADVVYTVTESRRNPYFNMVMLHNGTYATVLTSDFVARQQAPKTYDMNASIYAYSGGYIHSDRKKHDKADIVLMLDTGILDIDHELDFELMEVIAGHLYKNHKAFSRIRDGISCIVLEEESVSQDC